MRLKAALPVTLAVLAAQNLAIFWLHYTRDYGFPWDFNFSYHAVPFYWIEAVRHGAPLAWIPFQGMGYPIYLNLQSGLFYPPLWLFPLLDLPYTLHAAVLLQGAHVLLGALGAAWCARLMGSRWPFALLAGVMYQCFGGFYSNASHPDIVRAFALLPWVAAPVFGRWAWTGSMRAAILALPLAVYFLCTGAYTGSIIAILFVVGVLAAARMAAAGWNCAQARWIGAAIAAALLAGLLAAGAFLVPAALDRHELARAATLGSLTYEYLDVRHLLGLGFSIDSDFYSHDVTMRSLFVSLPVLGLALVRLGMGQWRRMAILLAAALLAWSMAAGWLHRPLAGLLPPLGYSRFPIADYRGFLGLAFALLAAQALQLASEVSDEPAGMRIAACTALLAFVFAGLVLPGEAIGAAQWAWTAAIVVLTMALLLWRGAAAFAARTRWTGALLVLALAVLVTADWARVNWNARYFAMPSASTWVAERLAPFTSSVEERFEHPAPTRPARVPVAETDIAHMPWRGYYTGEYMMQDYSGPTNIARYRVVAATPELRNFALRPWTALVSGTGVPDAGFSPEKAAAAPVKILEYGIAGARYEVDLPAPATVVENEMYWDGWTATAGSGAVRAIDVRGFRAWTLPAGRYTMTASFAPPHLRQGMLVSLAGLALWLLLALALFMGGRRGALAPRP